jgi:hypothetical protein
MFSSFTSPLFLLSLAIQVALVVHCVRTGRNTFWIWILIFAPLVGTIAYVLVEIAPELFGSRTAGRAVRGVRRALDPGQELRNREAAVQRTGDVASRQRYAEELLRHGESRKAMDVYRQAMTGLYAHDPNLMLGLAQAQFAAGLATDARSTLDALIERNPQFKSPDGHLLYARALEAEGNLPKAVEEYAAVAAYYAGAEARLRHGQLLSKLGRKEEARPVLEGLLEHARLAPRHYREAQEQWLASARRTLAEL